MLVHAFNCVYMVQSACSCVLFCREIDWLFSSDNGRRQLAELTGKLLVVTHSVYSVIGYSCNLLIA